VTRRTWVAIAVGTLTLGAGAAVLVGRSLQSAEPPRADLLQPVPSVPSPESPPALPRGPMVTPVRPTRSWTSPRAEESSLPGSCVQTTSGFGPEPLVEPPRWLDRPGGLAERPAFAPVTGTHRAVLDGGVLTLPPALRQQLGGRDAAGKRQVFVMPGTDGCLWLTTAAGLERLSEQMQQTGPNSRHIRQARRLCFAQAETCAVDRAGRVRIPDALMRGAGVQQQVILVGVGDRVELWDAQRWHHYVHEAVTPTATGSSAAAHP
jgi:MraZ protein